MSNLTKKNAPTLMERVSQGYENSPFVPLVAAVLSFTPAVGIDRLLSKKANDFALKQIRAFLYELHEVLRDVQRDQDPKSDAFIAGTNLAIQSLLQSTSEEKAKYFAGILAGAWNNAEASWSEMSQALKLIRDLEDAHFRILKYAFEAREQTENGQGIFAVGQSKHTHLRIESVLSDLDPRLIESCLSDLIAKGLLNDTFKTDNVSVKTDVRTEATSLPLLYSISELGVWFVEIIRANG